MSSNQSVTRWIVRAREGDQVAAQKLWQRYFGQLVRLARKKLSGAKRSVADEEDVALSAMDSFIRRAAAGRFPDLNDRNHLWPLLVTITVRKACKLAKHERRQKRGGSPVKDNSAPIKSAHEITSWDQIISREPGPAIAFEIKEEFHRLLEKLEEESLRQIALWKLEGYTNAEIAGKLQCVERTVERKLHLIRRIWEEDA
jgi:RNA polymerase sigma factor (sigma-70 family)